MSENKNKTNFLVLMRKKCVVQVLKCSTLKLKSHSHTLHTHTLVALLAAKNPNRRTILGTLAKHTYQRIKCPSKLESTELVLFLKIVIFEWHFSPKPGFVSL